MSDEVHCVLLKLVFGQHFLGRVVGLDAFVCFGIFLLEVLDSLKELLASPLLEETHEVRGECFLGSDWHFEDLEASLGEEATLLVLQDVGAVDGWI